MLTAPATRFPLTLCATQNVPGHEGTALITTHSSLALVIISVIDKSVLVLKPCKRLVRLSLLLERVALLCKGCGVCSFYRVFVTLLLWARWLMSDTAASCAGWPCFCCACTSSSGVMPAARRMCCGIAIAIGIATTAATGAAACPGSSSQGQPLPHGHRCVQCRRPAAAAVHHQQRRHHAVDVQNEVLVARGRAVCRPKLLLLDGQPPHLNAMLLRKLCTAGRNC